MPNIFVSYRRGDSGGWTGRLVDRLSDRFGSDSIFHDVETIAPGEDFEELIERRLAESDIVLVIIGPSWLSVTDSQGGRRIDNPSDFVHLEIRRALERGIRTIPVLVPDATMPTSDELPPPIAALGRRQNFELSATKFDSDMDLLCGHLGGEEDEPDPPESRPAPPTPPVRPAPVPSGGRAEDLSRRKMIGLVGAAAVVGGGGLVAILVSDDGGQTGQDVVAGKVEVAPTATSRPDPTATSRPDPTATSRPDPTATSRPDPTATRPPTVVPAPTDPPPTADPLAGLTNDDAREAFWVFWTFEDAVRLAAAWPELGCPYEAKTEAGWQAILGNGHEVDAWIAFADDQFLIQSHAGDSFRATGYTYDDAEQLRQTNGWASTWVAKAAIGLDALGCV